MTGPHASGSRRRFLAIAGLAPLALAGWGSARAASPVCVEPATLSFSQKSRRRAVGYVEPSADPRRTCGGCSFFTAAAAGCGTCTILGGGTVGALAVCKSFSAKPVK